MTCPALRAALAAIPTPQLAAIQRLIAAEIDARTTTRRLI
jgi:hypothetical protein